MNVNGHDRLWAASIMHLAIDDTAKSGVAPIIEPVLAMCMETRIALALGYLRDNPDARPVLTLEQAGIFNAH